MVLGIHLTKATNYERCPRRSGAVNELCRQVSAHRKGKRNSVTGKLTRSATSGVVWRRSFPWDLMSLWHLHRDLPWDSNGANHIPVRRVRTVPYRTDWFVPYRGMIRGMIQSLYQLTRSAGVPYDLSLILGIKYLYLPAPAPSHLFSNLIYLL